MSKNSDPMTYARLEEVLTTLGFTKKATDEFVAFLHEDTESIFVLPLIPASDTIRDWHLLSAQKVVMTSSSVSARALQRMLSKRRSFHPATGSELPEHTEGVKERIGA